MVRYLLKRLAWAAVVLWGITLVTFAIAFAIPGDPAELIAGPQASPELVSSIRRELGLDDPLPAQYGRFLGRLMHGDLGTSYSMEGKPVAEAIGERVGPTAILGLTAWLTWLVGGTLLGVLVAARDRPRADAALLIATVVGASLPTFWVGMMLLYLLADRIAAFPAGGYGSPAHLVLPALTLSVSGVAYYARLAHAGMRASMGQPFVRTARAKGVPEVAVLFRHALRSALLPLVTVAGADLAALMGGVVFTEGVFSWPGLGQLAVTAVFKRDLPLILGVVLVSAAFVVLANIAVDMLYPLLDPRVRLTSPSGSG